MPNAEGTGYVDYVLWGADGLPLAVVEAKRTTKSPQVGQQQAKLYADCLETEFGRRPVVFYSNGYEHWLWDDAAFGAAGTGAGYPPREVQGFHTRDELELMVQRRQTRLPLAGAPVDTAIVERFYQTRAVKAVGSAFDARQREALLVMATGSGKTRTVIALVDQLMKTNWAKRVLFLADRTALVNQAVNAFKTHLPGVTTVNLVTEKVVDGRVFVSTYPTMMNLIDDLEPAGPNAQARRRFGPGLLRPRRHRRGASVGLPEVRRDLRVVRQLPRRSHGDSEGRGRPQHLPALPARGRPSHRCLRARRSRRRRIPGAAVRRDCRHQVPPPGHHLRRAERSREGRVGCTRLGRGRSPGRGRLRGAQPVPVQRGHGRQGPRHADGRGAQGGRRRPPRQDHRLRQEPEARRVHRAAVQRAVSRVRR